MTWVELGAYIFIPVAASATLAFGSYAAVVLGNHTSSLKQYEAFKQELLNKYQSIKETLDKAEKEIQEQKEKILKDIMEMQSAFHDKQAILAKVFTDGDIQQFENLFRAICLKLNIPN